MPLVIDDRVRETTTVTGTSDATLLGAVTGFQAFSVIGNGNTTYYTISDQAGANFEVGIGTFSSIGPTLARTTILSSSNGNAKVSFPAGTKDVFVTYPSDKAVYLDESNNVQPALGIANATTVDTTNLEVTNLKAKDGTAAGSIANSTGVVTLGSSVLTTTDINGGTIDATTIGGSTAAAGNFTTLGASSTATLNTLVSSGATLTGGSINNMAVGASTASTGRFSTLEATGVSTFSAGTVSLPSITTTGDTNTGIFFPAADTIAFTEGGAEVARFDSSGNLGVGTASPLARLDVRTTSQAFNQEATISAYATDSQGINLGGSIALGGNADIPIRFGLIAGRKENSTSNNRSGYLQFATFENGVGIVERMRIDSSGNVGIGTSSPSSFSSLARNLVVNGTTNAGITISESTGGGTASLLFAATSAFPNKANITNDFVSNSLQFGLNATERMRIDSSGNVGIGVNPSQRFQVQGGRVRFDGNSENFVLQLNNSTTGNGPFLGSAGADIFVVSASSGAERMRIDSSGNVGIGTSSPATFNSKLCVVGGDIVNINDSASWLVRKARSDNSNSMGIFDPSGFGAMALYTAAAERMRIDSSGRVGIGTSSPDVDTLLTVAGAVTITGFNTGHRASCLKLGQDTSAISQLRFYGANNSTAGILQFTSSSADSSVGGERMRIDSAGNVLVGTTDAGGTTGVGTKQIANATVPHFINVVNDSTGSNYYLLYNTNATNNGYRFFVQANGGVANFSGNNTNLSDQRTKENIELSSSYLDKICAIPVKTFNYKDEPAGEQKTLGVIAQDVEAVAPEFVNNAGFGETKEGETPLKSIYTTDLMFALMKSIQELKSELDSVKAELQTLKGN